MLTIAPSGWTGVDLGAMGAGLLVLTAWAGLWMSSRLTANADSPVSPGEQKNGVSLLFTASILGVMFAAKDTIASATSMAETNGLGRVAVALVIGWLVFGDLLRQRLGAQVQEDERDRWVERRSDSAAHGMTVFLLIGLAVSLAASPSSRLLWATPIVIAHLLIAVLVLANLVGCCVAAWLYWQDRR